MGRICLIRHGETDWNVLRKLQGRTDIPLNENGRKQSKEVGEFLLKYQWDRIISSPLKRAVSTAKIIADLNHIDVVEINEKFIERCYGLAEGMTVEERQSTFPDRNYANMEELDVLSERIKTTVEQYAIENQNKNLIIVSHGGAINSLLYQLSHGAYGSGITRLHMGSVSMLEFVDGKLQVEYYNRKVTTEES